MIIVEYTPNPILIIKAPTLAELELLLPESPSWIYTVVMRVDTVSEGLLSHCLINKPGIYMSQVKMSPSPPT